MRLSLSKSLGKGFRIGTGTRLFSSSNKSGQSKLDLEKVEKVMFLKKIAEESNELLNQLLVNNNIEPKYAQKNKLDLDDLFAKTDFNKEYKAFLAMKLEVNEILSKVEYGGRLTSQRKDRLVDLIFSMRQIISSTGVGLNMISDEVAEHYGKKGLYYFIIVFIISILFTLLGSEKNSFVYHIFAIGIFTAILYYPGHVILDVLAKFRYQKLALVHMKNTFSLED